MSVDRIIVVPAQYVGQHDAELHITSDDGERATIALVLPATVPGFGSRTLAQGEDFRRAIAGLYTWFDAPENDVAGTFSAFLNHALNSSEKDARDGWSTLDDDASDWTDSLSIVGQDEYAV